MMDDKYLNCRKNEKGLALLTVMFLLVLMGGIFSAYLVITRNELKLVKSSRDSLSGFNAAEAGLNIRAEELRGVFLDFAQPEGSSPSSLSDCDEGTNLGTDDYQCRTYNFGNSHSATTYVSEDATNPRTTVIPPGETFAGLSAIEYRYNVTSVGRNSAGSNEAILDLTFQSRKVPLFQFMVFFDEDLEIFNGAVMTLNGPVHTNGDFYAATQDGGTTNYTGQVSVAGNLYRGMKSVSSCSGYSGPSRVSDTPDTSSPNYVSLPSCSGSRFEITDVEDWNDNIDLEIEAVTVPFPESMDSFSDGEYWQRADLRIVLRLDGSGNIDRSNSPTGVEIVDTAGNTDTTETNRLHNDCTGLVSEGGSNYVVGSRDSSDSPGNRLRLYREYQHYSGTNNYQTTLEVDVQGLLNCIDDHSSIMDGKTLDDDTQDGLVFFFAIDGPLSSSSQNNYSVRLRNGATLQSSNFGAPEVEGLTVVTDQGLIVWGDYNRDTADWVPAALMADTTWLLSNDWDDIDSEETNAYDRDGSATEVSAAVLSGIRRTGGINGEGGQDFGADSNGGGAINVFRFNEWFRVGSSSIPDFTYKGSMVSLGAPRKSNTTWGPFTYYSAPNRDWSFEERFNDPENLPPMTPVFIYLRQELFVRDYTIEGAGS